MIDSRHTADIDRSAIMTRTKRARVIPNKRLPPSFSSKFSPQPDVRSAEGGESEVEERMDIDTGAGAGVVKLKARAVLPSEEVGKQSKAKAAMAIAEANEPAEFDVMRPSTEEAALATEEGPPPKKQMFRPKPKGTAAAAAAAAGAGASVSAAAVEVKAQVKKIKEHEDSTVNISTHCFDLTAMKSHPVKAILHASHYTAATIPHRLRSLRIRKSSVITSIFIHLTAGSFYSTGWEVVKPALLSPSQKA